MDDRLFDFDRDQIQSQYQPHLTHTPASSQLAVAGLFAGAGGIERGLELYGGHAELLCENWGPAAQVLGTQFPGAHIVGDVRTLKSLPAVDLVSAGFPCTDLSTAGRKAGITGAASGLVREVFRLLQAPRAPMLLLENVRNMLGLDGGKAMRYLIGEVERLGYAWAYRLVDSRFAGVPQRRRRIIFLASRTVDPRTVLHADDAGEPGPGHFSDRTYGFYWTEGVRGMGWVQDAVPPLRAGSLGIPWTPGIWNPTGPAGRRLVVPGIEDTEQMQGFPRGWTEAAGEIPGDRSTRGRRTTLVGNAVTVGVAEWIGRRLHQPGTPVGDIRPLHPGDRWPLAAFGANGQAWAADLSQWPTHEPYHHLHGLVDLEEAKPLTPKAAAGFLSRALGGKKLRFMDGFLDDVADHARA